MTTLTEPEEMIGKTIDFAVYSYNASVLIRFTDGSVACIHARQRWGDLEIEFDGLEDGELVKVGAISEEEYNRRVKEADMKAAEYRKADELSALARLKAKYEKP